MQLEEGSVATKFERLPYSQVLLSCQRFFISNTSGVYENFGVGVASATFADIAVILSSTMRTAPTFSYSSALANFTLYDGVSSYTPTSIVLQDAPYGNICAVRVYATLTAGRAVRLGANNSTSARLNFSARL